MDGIGLRERKKSETRRAIAASALELALVRGPDEITVADIAAAANVSPRTVFNYFGTRDEAILGIEPERRAQLVAELMARPAGEAPLEALAAVLKAALTGGGDAGRLWRDRSRLVARYPHLRAAQAVSQAAFEADMVRAVARRTGLREDDPYCVLVVSASLLVSRGVLDRSGSSNDADMRRHLDDGFAALARGLTPPPSAPSRR